MFHCVDDTSNYHTSYMLVCADQVVRTFGNSSPPQKNGMNSDLFILASEYVVFNASTHMDHGTIGTESDIKASSML